ncbi:MAG: hypothetical protein J3K34DRAFT_205175 [Monoraphidium minutum]|nr:MAG: hypothetical protein J3K34DRAFT_205175 [Monoraphidium minutum]
MTAVPPELEAALRGAGYDGSTTLVLQPGRQRQELIAWAICRLVGGGRSAADVWRLVGAASDVSTSDQLLSEEERQAQRLQRLLGLLGVRASVDAIRGCSKGGSELLVRLAELVAAVEAQRVAVGGGAADGSGGVSTAGGDGGAASACAPQQLLESACDVGPRIWCETMQLFPRDMAPLLDEYRDAGERLPWALTNLQQRLADQATPPGGAGCAAPTAADLSAGMGAAAAAARDLTEAGRQLAGVFEQELSVWSEVVDDHGAALGGAPPQHRISGCAGSGAGSGGSGSGSGGGATAPEQLGKAAQNVLAGFQDVSCLVEAVGLLMDMHATLQDVPRDWLAELAATHSAAAAELGDGAALLNSP